MKPKVTIGVCVRNCELTILETIKSVIAQDYPHELIEIIVVDGYSSDKTVQITKEVLSNSDIRGHIFHENKGLGFARQIVVENAKGGYIVWVDGDMILPADFVRRHVEFMEKNQQVGIAKARYGVIKEDSLVAILENIEFMMTFRQEKEVSSEPLGTSGCIYRVEAIKQVGGFDVSIDGVGEDMDAEHRVKAAGWKLYVSPAYFYERRRKTWRDLWKEYVWHGKGGFRIFRKNRMVVEPYRMFPLFILPKKFIQAAQAYRIMHQKEVFLLPLHYVFKRAAWLFGFLREYMK